MSKILYISSEAFPLVKTGGLGDVAGSLPNALLKLDQDVRLLLPAYPQVLATISQFKIIAETTYYDLHVKILETRLPGTRVKTWLVDCKPLYEREGGPYSDSAGIPWPDNALRFAVLCHAAVDLSLNTLGIDWIPDIVHCNDWQTGLVPALLSLHSNHPVSVFTIHNLAYQGTFDAEVFQNLHLPDELWHMNGLEFYGQFSFIKGGLAFADKITTVSPTYAEEILQPEHGYGLEGLLMHRANDLKGIINGVDENQWNPGTDMHIAQKYNRRSLDKKIINKLEMQRQSGFKISEDIPLIGMISRMVEQKGFASILQVLDSVMENDLQMVILGTGESHFERSLTDKASQYKDKLNVTIGYSEELSHKIEAACDIYLMPSTFEPCGLNQLYSLRYGTVPIVTPVGGLADTVTDASPENIQNKSATGLIIKGEAPVNLNETIKGALDLYKQKSVWRQLQLTGMGKDFTWQASAQEYLKLYQSITELH